MKASIDAKEPDSLLEMATPSDKVNKADDGNKANVLEESKEEGGNKTSVLEESKQVEAGAGEL